MVHTLLMVVFVLVAIAMVVLILLQRGAGAQAGSGFGSGASGTVFGSRGSANFLSSSTKWLAAVFFSLSLFMAWQSSRDARTTATDAAAEGPAKVDLGVMADLPAGADTAKAPAPAAPLPAAAPATTAPAATEPVIAPAPAASTPANPQAPAPTGNKGG